MNILDALTTPLKEPQLFWWSFLLPLGVYFLCIIVNRLYLRSIGNENKRVSRWKLLAVPSALALMILYTTLLTRADLEWNGGASFFRAVRYTLHTFAIEDTLSAVLEDAKLSSQDFSWWENLYYASLLVLAPLSTASILLSFLKTPQFWWRIHMTCRGRKTQVYFFSDLNERAVTYARTLQEKSKNQRFKRKLPKPMMVFCMDEEKPESGEIDAMNVPGAIVLRTSICTLPLLKCFSRMRRMHFYLVTDDENKKLNQAQVLLQKYHGTGCHIRCISSQQTNDYEVDTLNKRYTFWDTESLNDISAKRRCRFLVKSAPDDRALPSRAKPWLTFVCQSGNTALKSLFFPCLKREGGAFVWYTNSEADKNPFLRCLIKWRNQEGCKRFQRIHIEDAKKVLFGDAEKPWLTIVYGVKDFPCRWFQINVNIKKSLYKSKFLLRRARWRCFAYVLCSKDRSQNYHEAQLLYERSHGQARGALICFSEAWESPGLVPLCFKAKETTTPSEDHSIQFRPGGEILDTANIAEAQGIRSNFIDLLEEASNLVYVHLHHKPLMTTEFMNAFYQKPASPEVRKPMRVLVLGSGAIGEELARICLWYCQLPGMRAEVTVADQEDANAILGKIMKDHMDIPPQSGITTYRIDSEGNALLFVKGGVDFRSKDLEELLESSEKKDKGYHAIFVCSGDDDLNYRLALRLRRYYLRVEPQWGCPQIRVNIWSDNLHELLSQSDALKGSNKAIYPLTHQVKRFNERCEVSIFGTMQESMLQDDALRFDALRYHAHYCNVKSDALHNADESKELLIPLAEYHGYYGGTESDRRSNMAAAIHGLCKYTWYQYAQAGKPVPAPSAAEWPVWRKYPADILALGETEHRRWCVFKLLEGSSSTPDDRMDKLFDFAKHKVKTRDLDSIRGYHAVIRPWADVQRLTSPDAYPDKTNNAHLAHAVRWQEIEHGNYALAQFSIELESCKESLRKAAAAKAEEGKSK